MEKAKKDNSSLWIAGAAAAAVLGGLMYAQRAKASQAASIMPEEYSAPPSESLVQNSISSEEEEDAAKDDAINDEDNGFNQEDDMPVPTKTVSLYKPKPVLKKQGMRSYSDQNKSLYNNNGSPKATVPTPIDTRDILWKQKARNAVAQKTKNLLPVLRKPLAPAKPSQQTFPLKLGSRNALVSSLQQKLGIKADGIFGKITEATLAARFQIKVIANATMFQSIMNSPKLNAPVKPNAKPKKVAPKKIAKRLAKKKKK